MEFITEASPLRPLWVRPAPAAAERGPVRKRTSTTAALRQKQSRTDVADAPEADIEIRPIRVPWQQAPSRSGDRPRPYGGQGARTEFRPHGKVDSIRVGAALAGQHRARRPARLVRQQLERGAGHVVGVRDVVHGKGVSQGRAPLVRRDPAVEHFRAGGARRDAVHPDVLARILQGDASVEAGSVGAAVANGGDQAAGGGAAGGRWAGGVRVAVRPPSPPPVPRRPRLRPRRPRRSSCG